MTAKEVGTPNKHRHYSAVLLIISYVKTKIEVSKSYCSEHGAEVFDLGPRYTILDSHWINIKLRPNIQPHKNISFRN